MEDTPLSELYDTQQLFDELEANMNFLAEYYNLYGSETFFQCQEIVSLLKLIDREKNI